MVIRNQAKNNSGSGNECGYTLMELLVVMAIIAILATQMLLSFNSAPSRVKGVVFNMRGDFNYARSEAVKRNHDVRTDFFFVGDGVDLNGDGAADDGYRIWVDDTLDGNYVAWVPADDVVVANGVCDAGEGDCLLKAVAFSDEVNYYNVDAVDGPLVAAPEPHAAMSMADGDGDDDGVSFNNNWFAMRPDGTSNIGGTVYIYGPQAGQPTVMKSPPLAVVLSPTSGRVQILRWKTAGATWETK
ncbi:MAG: prepilin-type N-terminal cleavage/methylation domain-containing protein [Desulfobulbaceae bacterium]|nr:prepilin-type N-terminal cleavage/methylation domain-containing protein [Desulfobulbaceae bacterium]